jgi:hypothetical protein
MNGNQFSEDAVRRDALGAYPRAARWRASGDPALLLRTGCHRRLSRSIFGRPITPREPRSNALILSTGRATRPLDMAAKFPMPPSTAASRSFERDTPSSAPAATVWARTSCHAHRADAGDLHTRSRGCEGLLPPVPLHPRRRDAENGPVAVAGRRQRAAHGRRGASAAQGDVHGDDDAADHRRPRGNLCRRMASRTDALAGPKPDYSSRPLRYISTPAGVNASPAATIANSAASFMRSGASMRFSR